MASSWWDEGVPVVVQHGRTVNVTGPRRAAELLLDPTWPADPRTAKQRKARAAVLKALQAASDSKAQMAARQAFEAAVDEADMRGAPVVKSKAAPAVMY